MNDNVGAKSGLLLTITSPYCACLMIHDKNSNALPASKTKTDHGSVAPKAAGPNNNSPNKP